MSRIKKILRNSNYRLYFIGQLVSLSGSWAQTVALSWLVFRTTHSSIAVGSIAFASQLPAFLLTPFAGAIVDRFEKRRIFFAVQWAGMLQALLLAALIFSGYDSLPAILGLCVLMGLINAFDLPTRHSLVVEIVDRGELSSAIALNSALMNITRVLGPALAGALIRSFGEKWCFVFNAASYVAIVASLTQMKFHPVVRKPPSTGVLRSMLEGFSYLWARPRMVRIVVGASILSAVQAGYMVLLPWFARSRLAGSADVFAWLTSLFAMGAVIGAVSAAARGRGESLRKDMLISVLWLGVTLIVFAHSRELMISLFCAALIGYHTIRTWPVMNNAMQEMVSDEMRGRVMSFFMMTFLGMTPLVSLLVGWISDHVGAVSTLTWIGGLSAVAALVVVISAQFESVGPSSQTKPAQERL